MNEYRMHLAALISQFSPRWTPAPPPPRTVGAAIEVGAHLQNAADAAVPPVIREIRAAQRADAQAAAMPSSTAMGRQPSDPWLRR